VMGSEREHDRLTSIIASLVHHRYQYDRVDTHVEYRQNGLEGELDVVASNYDGRTVYFEVKSWTGGYENAIQQFMRAHRAGVADSFVYVDPEAVRRWTP
jgi:hypothetical protein